MTRRQKKLIAALESAGHTNVKVWWESMGPALEMCGNSGGYFFTSKEQKSLIPLGLSLAMALDTVKYYKRNKDV